jgi:hypothetical protein
MTKRLEKIKGELGWNFAIINGRQGEVFFEIGKGIKGIVGHAYHTPNDKKRGVREKKMMERDNKKNIFTYRSKKYRIKAPSI